LFNGSFESRVLGESYSWDKEDKAIEFDYSTLD